MPDRRLQIKIVPAPPEPVVARAYARELQPGRKLHGLRLFEVDGVPIGRRDRPAGVLIVMVRGSGPRSARELHLAGRTSTVVLSVGPETLLSVGRY